MRTPQVLGKAFQAVTVMGSLLTALDVSVANEAGTLDGKVLWGADGGAGPSEISNAS